MRHLWALTTKDLLLLVRDRVGLFFCMIFPLVYGVMFGLIFGGAGGDDDQGGSAMKLLVVDADDTEGSRAFVDVLAGAEEFAIERLPDEESAVQMVRRGSRPAYVLIPPGFGEARERTFWGEPARLKVGVDPARRAEASMIQGILTKYAYQRLQEVFSDPSALRKQALAALDAVALDGEMEEEVRGPLQSFLQSLRTFADDIESAGESGEGPQGEGAAGWEPVRVEVNKITAEARRGEPPSAFAVSFPQATVWAVMGCAAAFGISLVVERTRGTLMRLRIAPIPRWHILLGKAGACFLSTITVAVVLLAAGAVLGVRCGTAELPKVVLAVLSIALGFVGIMMLLSVVGKTEAAAGGIGWAVLLLMAMVGGGMVPLFLLPGWMQQVGTISPVKWSILALEGALWRGYSYGEMLLPCAIMLGVGAVSFSIGAAAFRWGR